MFFITIFDESSSKVVSLVDFSSVLESIELLLSKVTIVEVLVVVFLGTSEFESLLPQAPNVILENKINPNPTIFFIFSSKK